MISRNLKMHFLTFSLNSREEICSKLPLRLKSRCGSKKELKLINTRKRLRFGERKMMMKTMIPRKMRMVMAMKMRTKMRGQGGKNKERQSERRKNKRKNKELNKKLV
jgi:hypothetical protein